MAGADSVEKLEDVVVRSAEQAAEQIRAAKDAISSVIFGQDRVIENTLVTILSGGHALLSGVPGLAKTKLVETLGVTLGLDAKRIQFTPDLMPSDILGAEVLDESSSGKRSFRFISGPVFAQLLMADEINRASPRTQSALLQAMQEQHITVAGARHDLPKPFHVLATQNPLEQEGTYPLPEAQLDRFLMEIDVDYPDRDAERRILFETTGAEETLAKAAMNADILITAQRLVRRLPVGDSVVEAILSLVRSARPGPEGGEAGKLIAWGPGPRASQSLMLAVRARALLDGRLAPSIDDGLDLADPGLEHRRARDDHLYVREQEWEAAHTVWLWPDRSPSMAFASRQARDSKLERALIVTFALAELLVAGGERVGIPGLINPTASSGVIDKMAQAMLHDDAARLSLPPSFVPSAMAEIVVLSDFWSPISEIRRMLAGLSASGAHGTLVQIVDPAEESFPYSGRIEFVEPEGGSVITAGRAEKWAGDYVARVALHRDEIRADTNKLDWLFSTHTTSRSAAELLLFLHAGMMVAKGSARTATVKAGRSA